MSTRGVSVRMFLLLSVLALLALSGAAALPAFLLEQHSQRSDRDERLTAAAAYVEHRNAEVLSRSWQGAFARKLDALDLSAELAVVALDEHGKLALGAKRIYVSSALRPDGARPAAQAVSGTSLDDLPINNFAITREPSSEHTFPFREKPGTGDVPQPRLLLRLYAPPLDRGRQAFVALVFGLLALLAGLAVVSWTASRWFVTPLRQLSSHVDAIAGGELAVTPPLSRIREVTNIAGAVSGMAEALARTAKAEARLEAKRRFLITAAAHDLRTPLFSLRSYLDAIASGIGLPDEQLEKARAKAGQIDRLVTSLFAYARADLDDEPHLESADLAEAVRRATSAFEHAASERRVTLRLGGNGRVPVTIDRDRFERAIANILDNAFRYTPEGGVIDVAYGHDTDTAYVRIDDSGPGIEPDLLPHVFEPMVRAGRARRFTGGAGLGLTIAARLLESQGGTVSAANRTEGGASLTLRLPHTGSS
jgi:signal transduction histidine kinase